MHANIMKIIHISPYLQYHLIVFSTISMLQKKTDFTASLFNYTKTL